MEHQPRTQVDRTAATRGALVTAARALFGARGFAAVGTEEVVRAAGVSRGALYHHFADKAALFEAVIRTEAKAVATAIEDAEFGGLSPIETLVQGGEAYLAAMRAPGRTRLLLVQAPAVLPPEVLARIDGSTGGRTLAEGLAAAGIADPGPLSALLSAACERAALAIDKGDSPGPWRTALERLVRGAVR